MINKEMLSQFICKPTQSTEKLLTMSKLEIYYPSNIEERGWAKAKILLTNF